MRADILVRLRIFQTQMAATESALPDFKKRM